VTPSEWSRRVGGGPALARVEAPIGAQQSSVLGTRPVEGVKSVYSRRCLCQGFVR
jgi:hypothetical protein